MLNLYKKFKLSLIGKVNVIKTLALPKLVYRFAVLPNLDNSTLVKIKNLFKDFLWGKGQVKIVTKQLEKTIGEGSLKLINIDLFNKTLKLTWIRRLITTSGYRQNLFSPPKVSQHSDNTKLSEPVSLTLKKPKVKGEGHIFFTSKTNRVTKGKTKEVTNNLEQMSHIRSDN